MPYYIQGAVWDLKKGNDFCCFYVTFNILAKIKAISAFEGMSYTWWGCDVITCNMFLVQEHGCVRRLVWRRLHWWWLCCGVNGWNYRQRSASRLYSAAVSESSCHFVRVLTNDSETERFLMLNERTILTSQKTPSLSTVNKLSDLH